MSIPKTVVDADMIGNMLDLMSYESQQLVVPAYSKWIFEGKKIQRIEDTQMLEIIMNGQVVDPAHLWLETGLYDSLKELISIGTGENEGDVSSSGVVSLLEGAKSKVNVTNQEFLEMIKKLY